MWSKIYKLFITFDENIDVLKFAKSSKTFVVYQNRFEKYNDQYFNNF